MGVTQALVSIVNLSSAPNSTATPAEVARQQNVRRREDLIHLAGIAVFLLFVGLWFASVVMDPNVLDGRDWQAFDVAANKYWLDDGMPVYRFSDEAKLHFLYPPFVLIAIAPLAWLSEIPSYLACSFAIWGCLVAAFICLFKFFPNQPAKQKVALSLTLCSAPSISLLPTAQITPVCLLMVLGTFLAWRRQHLVTAGLILSLLFVKPNLAVPFVVVLLVRRQWRIAGGCLIGIVAAALVSLPLGWGLWSEYFEAVSNMSRLTHAGGIANDKQITLHALWSFLLDPKTSGTLLKLVWMASIAPLGVALVACWWKSDYRQSLPRLLSLTVLFVVIANPYLFFYDGLLLAIPAWNWYMNQDGYNSRRVHLLCGLMLAAAYVWLFNLFLNAYALPLFFVSCPLVIWFAVDAWDYIAPRSREREFALVPGVVPT